MADPEALGYIQRAKEVLFRPKEFFSKLKSRKLADSIKYYSLFALIALLFSLFSAFMAELEFSAELIFSVLIFSLGSIFFAVVALFILAAAINLLSGLMGGKEDFNLTFKALAYAETPNLGGSLFFSIPWLLALLVKDSIAYMPLIGLSVLGALIASIGAFYSIYLDILGVAKVQDFAVWKSVLAWIFGTVAVLGILGVWAALVWPMMM